MRSPVSGRAGSLLVHAGNVVKANETALVTINQIRPILVRFAVPQQELPIIQAQMAQGRIEARITIAGDDQHAEQGELNFVDNAVDAATGTILLKALCANPEGRLWPSQFVDARLTLKVEQGALVVPSQAVLTGQKGAYVYIVNPDLTVSNRAVTVTRNVENETVIAEGLKPGEQVVTDGQLRLAPGARVKIQRDRAARQAPQS